MEHAMTSDHDQPRGNAWFLASAALMLGSCLLVSLGFPPDDEGLLTLLGSLAVYEGALAALAILVLAAFGARHDGRTLAALALLFAADPTFTWQRAAGLDAAWVVTLPAVIAVLAAAKLWAAARWLGLPLRAGQVAALCALAGG